MLFSYLIPNPRSVHSNYGKCIEKRYKLASNDTGLILSISKCKICNKPNNIKKPNFCENRKEEEKKPPVYSPRRTSNKPNFCSNREYYAEEEAKQVVRFASRSKRCATGVLKLLLAGGLTYATLYYRVWGNQDDTKKLIERAKEAFSPEGIRDGVIRSYRHASDYVANTSFDEAKSDISKQFNNVATQINDAYVYVQNYVKDTVYPDNSNLKDKQTDKAKAKQTDKSKDKTDIQKGKCYKHKKDK